MTPPLAEKDHGEPSANSSPRSGFRTSLAYSELDDRRSGIAGELPWHPRRSLELELELELELGRVISRHALWFSSSIVKV